MERHDAKRIEEFIKALGEEELRHLNRLIVEGLKLISQAKSTVERARLNIGELVQSESNDRRTLTRGRVIKLNKKTASILTNEQPRWNVAPAFLRSAETK